MQRPRGFCENCRVEVVDEPDGDDDGYYPWEWGP
jgi:hypothetical protein